MDSPLTSPRGSIDLGAVLRRRGSVVRRHRRHSRIASATTDDDSDPEPARVELPVTEKPRHKNRRLSASKLRLLGGNIISLVHNFGGTGSPRESAVIMDDEHEETVEAAGIVTPHTTSTTSCFFLTTFSPFFPPHLYRFCCCVLH